MTCPYQGCHLNLGIELFNIVIFKELAYIDIQVGSLKEIVEDHEIWGKMDKHTHNKKSPLKERPLRQAGQSLTEEIHRIFDEEINFYVIVIIFFMVLVVLEWFRWFLKTSLSPFLISIIAVFITAFSGRKIFIHHKNIKKLRLALDGERLIGESLEALREKGHRVFHDLIGGNFNVDHVIVGPKGVFSIETKTISKPAKGQSQIDYDGEKIRVNGFSPDRDPIVQSKAQANWIKALIVDSTGKKIAIRPVVLYPGWFISPQPKNAEVWVLNEKAFPVFLDNEQTALTTEEIILISAHLARYSRTTVGSHETDIRVR